MTCAVFMLILILAGVVAYFVFQAQRVQQQELQKLRGQSSPFTANLPAVVSGGEIRECMYCFTENPKSVDRCAECHNELRDLPTPVIQTYLSGSTNHITTEEYGRRGRAWRRASKLCWCNTCNFAVPPALFRECPKCTRSVLAEFVPYCPRGRLQLDVVLHHGTRELEQFAAQLAALETRARPLPLAAVSERSQRLLQARQFAGAGNFSLEVLMTCPVSMPKTELTLFLAEFLPHAVATKYGVDVDFLQGSVCQPLRDVYVPQGRSRTDWWIVYLELILCSYLLGATWKTLPHPMGELVPFFLFLADKHREEIEKAAKGYTPTNLLEPPPPVETLEQEIADLLRSKEMGGLGFSPEEAAAEIAAKWRNNGYRP